MGRTSWAEGEILLASSTERIRDRLVERGAQASFFDPISKEVEAELLARIIHRRWPEGLAGVAQAFALL
jgi:hypothetical protein